MLAGHVTVLAGAAAGTVRHVELTQCLRRYGSASFGVLLLRPFRNDAAPNTAPIAADDLAGGFVAAFHSREAASTSVRRS